MKKIVLAMMACLAVSACAVTSPDDPTVTDPAEQVADEAAPQMSKAEQAIRGDELTPTDGDKTPNACPRLPDGVCVEPAPWVHTCNFECCSGEFRQVQAACGECNARASSWCGSGVHHTYWTW